MHAAPRSPARRPFRRLAAALALALAAAAAAHGCDVAYGACAVQCGDAGCPDGLACAQDGFCHAPGDPAECTAGPGAGSAGRDGSGGATGGAPGGAGNAPGGAGNAPGGGGAAGDASGGAGAPTTATQACATAKVECGPATDPNGQAIDCGGCAGPSRCDAGKCACTSAEWTTTDLGAGPVADAAVAVDVAGTTHVLVRAPDHAVRYGVRAPGAAAFAFDELGPGCPGARLGLATTPDGTTHVLHCAPDADAKPAFHYRTRPPGGALAEQPPPADGAAADPILLAGADGTLHLLYTTKDAGVTHARRPPGGEWTPAETFVEGPLKAAALNASTLVVGYGKQTAASSSFALATLDLGAGTAWRLIDQVEQGGGLIDASGSLALAVRPNGQIVAAHETLTTLSVTTPLQLAYALYGLTYGPDGQKLSEERFSRTSLGRREFDAAVAVDDAGRAHVVYTKRDPPADAAAVAHAINSGVWVARDPPPQVASLSGETNFEPPPVALAASKAGLHAVYGGVLAELCQ
jgi:hypothetical protein